MHISVSRLWNADSIICDQNRKYTQCRQAYCNKITVHTQWCKQTYTYTHSITHIHTLHTHIRKSNETRAYCRDTLDVSSLDIYTKRKKNRLIRLQSLIKWSIFNWMHLISLQCNLLFDFQSFVYNEQNASIFLVIYL